MDAVILSGGVGKRFGEGLPKTFAPIAGKPLLYYSLYSFNKYKHTGKIYIVINSAFEELADKYKRKYFAGFEKFAGFIPGGSERKDSVYNALSLIKERGGSDYIAIHDGARPFIKPELINEIYTSATIYKAAAPGIKIVDAIKIVDGDGIIAEHPVKNLARAIQTPQIFDFDLIYNAYKNSIGSGKVFTDDTELLADTQTKIKIVDGDDDLLKITFRDDLIKAKKIYGRIKKLWK